MLRPDDISRVTRPREEAAKTYDRLATLYYLVVDRLEHKCREMGLAKLMLQAGESVLEIGFGTGPSLADMAQAVGASGKVLGIDLSERMMAIAQARIDKAGLSSRTVLVEGDAVHIPVPDDTLDAIFISYVLELFDTPDIPLVLGEGLRLLHPGGRICVVALSKAGTSVLATKLYEVVHGVFPRYLDCRPIYAARSLSAAGFCIRDVEICRLFGLDVEVVLATKPDE